MAEEAAADDKKAIKERIQTKEFDGLLVLPAGLPDEGQPEYVSSNVTAMRMLWERLKLVVQEGGEFSVYAHAAISAQADCFKPA